MLFSILCNVKYWQEHNQFCNVNREAMDSCNVIMKVLVKFRQLCTDNPHDDVKPPTILQHDFHWNCILILNILILCTHRHTKIFMTCDVNHVLMIYIHKAFGVCVICVPSFKYMIILSVSHVKVSSLHLEFYLHGKMGEAKIEVKMNVGAMSKPQIKFYINSRNTECL